MGEVVCDDCGRQPGALLENGHGRALDCGCVGRDPVAYEFEQGGWGRNEEPPQWGSNGGDSYVCFRCGAEPHLRTSTSGGGRHPTINHHLGCDCPNERGASIGFRSVLPDAWKEDMDPTKWSPGVHDDVRTLLEAKGPMDREEIAYRLNRPEECIRCVTIWMQREHELGRTGDGEFEIRGVDSP